MIEPDEKGVMSIVFSEELRFEGSILDWTSQNEGSDKLEIDYIPSQDTWELF